MNKPASAYAQKLKDPRWQKVRLQVLERDEWTCQCCFDSESTLFVHHGYYQSGKEPWEYPLESLHTVCEDCHKGADLTRDGIKTITGEMSLDAQFLLVDALLLITQLSYGDLLCLLSGLSHVETLNKLGPVCVEAMRARAAANQKA